MVDERMILPHDVEAEKLLLGACLLQPEIAELAAERLGEQDFYLSKLGQVFKAIVTVVESGKIADHISVKNEMVRRGIFEEMGGSELLVDLVQSGWRQSLEQTEQIIDMLLDFRIRRQLYEMTRAIREKVNTAESGELLLNEIHGELYEISSKYVKADHERIGDSVMNLLDKVLNEDKKPDGIKTGLTYLDGYTQGFQPGEFILMAGRPGTGKSSLLRAIAKNLALQGKKVAFFSLEVTREQVVANLLCGMAKMSAIKLRSGFVSQVDRKVLVAKAEIMQNWQMIIDDAANLSIMGLRTRARQIKHKMGLDVLFVDYLQLMTANRAWGDNRQIEVAAISRGLKLLAKELEIPVIAASQLTRPTTNENEPPKLFHLRESGALEQDADLVFLLHVYEKATNLVPAGTTELNLAKHRNGPTGKVSIKFVKEFALFMDPNDSGEV